MKTYPELPGNRGMVNRRRFLKTLGKPTLAGAAAPLVGRDVEEVLTSIKTNSGLENLHATFYEDDDLPDKHGVWDRWKLEGPAFAWYF